MPYRNLEPSILSETTGIATQPSNTFTTFSDVSLFIYTLFFVVITMVAFYRYVIAGVLRMQASESGITQSNEIIKRVTLGIVGTFSLFLILFTVNKGLVTGDVQLNNLRADRAAGYSGAVQNTTGTQNTPVTTTSSSGGNSASCNSPQETITKLQSPGGICGGARCTALSGCNYQPYLPIIDSAVGSDTKLRKMIIVAMCKESRANPNARNINSNGTYDCGIMQINQSGPCELNPSPASVEANIREGVTRMRRSISIANQTYPNIPIEAGAFSSYNCCANGTVPNSPSADCTTVSGFPYAIPKWACPINPGRDRFNMCSVKNYACEAVACMQQL